MYQENKDIPFADQLALLKNLTSYWEGINKSVIDYTKGLGQTNKSLKNTGSYSFVVSKNLEGAASSLEEMGIDAKVASTFLSQMVRDTGTMVGFAKDAMVKYGALSDILGATNIDPILGGLFKLGKGLTNSTKLIEDMYESSKKMGLDGVKVTEVISANFRKASNMSFKGGSKGIADMARESVLLGVNMDDVLSKARELRSPEQAIEFSQNMQMLGGDFATLFGDASNVLYNARNNTKQFQKDISKAASNLITFNKVTGELDVLPENLDRATLAANQLGQDVDTFLESGKKAAKLNIIKGAFGKLSEDQANILSGFADLQAGGAISLEGLDQETLKKVGLTNADLTDITKLGSEKMLELVDTLKEKGKNEKQTAENQVKATMTLSDTISSLDKTLNATITTLNDFSKDLNTNIKDIFTNKIKKNVIEPQIESVKGVAEQLYGEIKDEKKIEEYTKKKGEQAGKELIGENKKIVCNKDYPIEVTFAEYSKYDENDKKVIGGSYCVKNKKETQKKDGGVLRKGNIITKKLSNGAILNGPSHEQGGIPALNKSNGKMIEVEGGEAIINKKSTEMFKPLLSKINEAGGGIKFADGGIPKLNIEDKITKLNPITNSTDINVTSNKPINVNVNVNGTISIDGKNIEIPEEEKEKFSKNIMKQVLDKVNREIGNSTILNGGKMEKMVNTWDI